MSLVGHLRHRQRLLFVTALLRGSANNVFAARQREAMRTSAIARERRAKFDTPLGLDFDHYDWLHREIIRDHSRVSEACRLEDQARRRLAQMDGVWRLCRGRAAEMERRVRRVETDREIADFVAMRARKRNA